MADAPTTDAKPSRDDILAMARAAGLVLPPAYFDELVSAYGLVREMAARLPTRRPRGDEPAHTFAAGAFLPVEG